MSQTPPLKTAGPGHAMIQRLLSAFAQEKTMAPASDRGLVSKSEATFALLIAAATTDANYQSGTLDDFSTETAMRALTVAWERISPLPEEVTAGEGTVSQLLREYLTSLREARSRFRL